MAGSQHCLHTLNHTVVVLDQKDTPTNYLNVVVIYTRNHLFQGACLDIDIHCVSKKVHPSAFRNN